jgi:exonuclease SbcD
MRFFHTADWHLGRIFHNVSLLDDQKYMIEQLISEIEKRKPDAVLIAGDVYDKAIPPEGAIRLLEDFINRVAGQLSVPIIMISGNHDSGARLSFASSVLQKADVHIIGKATLDTFPIILNDEHGELYVYPLPYLSPLAARSLYKDSEIKSHQDIIERQVACILNEHPKDKRSLLILHEFVLGATESDSERQLTVGGSSHIESGIVSAFDYVAIGHLHRAQACGHEYIRYSGSLLKYSFSEVKHNKGVTEVIFDADGFAEYNTISLKPKRDMRIIQGKLDDILQRARLDTCTEDYICAELLDEGALYEPMRRLQEVYPNTLEIRRPTKNNNQGNTSNKSFHDLHKQDVAELFDEFYLHVCTEPLNDAQQTLVKNLVEQLEQIS